MARRRGRGGRSAGRSGTGAGETKGKTKGTGKGGSAGAGGAKAAQGEAADSNARPRGGPLELLKTVVIAALLFIVVRSFLIQTFVITSGSMENTLLVGDFLVVNRAAMGSHIPFTDIRIPGYSEPERGDVLVFDPVHEDTLILVKRLVGMPGDTLEMRDRVLYLNGVEQDEPYVVHVGSPDYSDRDMLWQNEYLVGGPRADYRPSRDTWGPIVVPAGRYFMLGDNRQDSHDARVWGFIERWRFQGRAFAIYFSYDKESFRPFPWIREVRWSRLWDRVR